MLFTTLLSRVRFNLYHENNVSNRNSPASSCSSLEMNSSAVTELIIMLDIMRLYVVRQFKPQNQDCHWPSNKE